MDQTTNRPTASLFAVPAVLIAALFAGCLQDPDSGRIRNGGEDGTAFVAVKVGKVGSLRKSSAIALDELHLTLSAPGQDTLRDTLTLLPSGSQNVGKTYTDLSSLVTWTLSAQTRDAQGEVIHSGTTTFMVPAGGTQNVNLALSSLYSHLRARFFPIRDSVTSVSLFVENVLVEDSTFAKQSLVGDTVSLNWNYLPASPTGTASAVRLEARGDYMGQPNVLLYRGSDTIKGFSGLDTIYRLTLQWMHPTPPPFGQASIEVTLGAVGTILVSGRLVDTSSGPVVYSWQIVGSAGFSESVPGFISVAVDATDHPVLAYSDWNIGGKGVVKRWTGSVWAPVGPEGFTPAGATHMSVAMGADDLPVVAFQDESETYEATVMRWTGLTWETIGDPGFSDGVAHSLTIAINGSGNPVVAFRDAGNSDKGVVKRWNGTAWQSLGSGFSDGFAGDPAMVLDSSGNPVVAFADITRGGKLTVMRWSGSAWDSVGSPGVTAGGVGEPALALDASGRPVVAFLDQENESKVSVLRWNGSAWVAAGTGLSTGLGASPAIRVDGSGRYVLAFSDWGKDGKASVLRYEGSQWLNIGTPDPSPGTTMDLTMTLDESGNPILGFADGEADLKPTVMRYAPTH